jgi:response regulator RpfG family c-di-GMP phosphodiesterase
MTKNMSAKILLVDDDPNILSGFQRTLRNRYSLETATGGEEALRKIKSTGPYAVVVADMQMPAMSGLDLLVKVEVLAPDTIRMMLTGNADQKTAVEAVNRGHVFRFLNKPCAPDSLVSALSAGIKQFELVTAERELLERTLNGTIHLLTEVLVSVYPEAFGRSDRVRTYVREYARFFQFKQSWDLEAAALLAPVGYLTIPSTVVDKSRSQSPLTRIEERMLQRLPEIGANLLGNIPRLESVAAIVRYQRKHYDGSGIPEDNLAGEDIPLGARILRVLQDLAQFESETQDKAGAFATMRLKDGVYDPQVLESAVACFDVYPEAAKVDQHVIRPVTLKDLTVGQTLGSNVETSEGILVAAAGTELTRMVLHRLRNFAELNPLKEPLYIKANPSKEFPPTAK